MRARHDRDLFRFSRLRAQGSAAELSRFPAAQRSAAELSRFPTVQRSAAELSHFPAAQHSAAELSHFPAAQRSAAELSRFPWENFKLPNETRSLYHPCNGLFSIG